MPSLTPATIQQWAAALSTLLALGASIEKLIALVRASMSPADADAVLQQVLAGWRAAKAENDARTAELEAAIAGTQ